MKRPGEALLSARRSVKHAARLTAWRWIRNGPSSLGYLLRRPRCSSVALEVAASLRASGIIVRASSGDKTLFEEVLSDAQRRRALTWDEQGLRPGAVNWKNDRSAQAVAERKDFLIRLLPAKLPADSVYLRYALQDDFLDAATAYLRLPPQLRAVHLWLNFPTPGDPASTQLWHRDSDDMVNLKVFTYLSDVDEASGPFAFAPGTHPFGPYGAVEPEAVQPGRSADGAMAKIVGRASWAICVGGVGTTVFADTCGLHKGVKPKDKPRLMLMCQYTSPAAWSGRDLTIEGGVPEWCSPRQAAAITCCLN